MVSLKHLVAALALGTAFLTAPLAANATILHHSKTTHPISHKKKKHHHKRRRHAVKHTVKHTKKSVALHSRLKPHALHTVALKTSRGTKAVALKTGSRHHPSL